MSFIFAPAVCIVQRLKLKGHQMPNGRFTTDKGLIGLAKIVKLEPPEDKAVFYADKVGASRARDFIRKNPSHVRIDELLSSTPEGRNLLAHIGAETARKWSDREEIWLLLSIRLAEAASGVVNCFGPDRLTRNEPAENSEHLYTKGAYANTQFEKAEWPALENNPKVTCIKMNGKIT